MIKLLDDVITQDQADKLIDICDQNLEKLKTLGKPVEGYRVADGTWLDLESELSKQIHQMISSHIGFPTINMERVHIVRYMQGGEYKEHHDFFHSVEDYYDYEMGRGGQRVKSVLIYLNDDFVGGETYFPCPNRKIIPKKRMMLVWDNLLEDGCVDYDTLHSGLPVVSGKKYILLVWVREREFIL